MSTIEDRDPFALAREHDPIPGLKARLDRLEKRRRRMTDQILAASSHIEVDRLEKSASRLDDRLTELEGRIMSTVTANPASLLAQIEILRGLCDARDMPEFDTVMAGMRALEPQAA